MILKIAWRNIWRSKLRSFTVMGAIVVGVWALVFYLGFTTGFMDAYVANAIENELSHIQVHHPKYTAEKEAEFYIKDTKKAIEAIAKNKEVLAYTQRTVLNGMLSSSKGARGVAIKGIIADQEAATTQIDKKIIDGVYFTESKKSNPILISKRLAEKMKLKVKSKIVLRFQATDGELKISSFKIIGLYQTSNKNFDELNIFVPQQNLTDLLGGNKVVHEIAILLNDIETISVVQSDLKKALADTSQYLVESYLEVSPDVNMYKTQLGSSSWIIITIVMLALIFGIINTMLMAVLERTREFGMLMAVGMKRRQIFNMVLTETFMLAALATPIAILFGGATILYFGNVGIQMAALEQIGLSKPIYPSIDVGSYLKITFSVAFTAFLAALYPARKATKLKPVDAIRKI